MISGQCFSYLLLCNSERLHFELSLWCIGEGNGNPLQCSCLENPRDGGAWWAAVYGVTQSRTRLKWLSSNSSSNMNQPRVHMCSPILNPFPISFPTHIPLGFSRALALSALLHASNLHWSSVSHMVLYMFQWYSLKSSHPHLLPHSPKVCSLYLCLFCCLVIESLLPFFDLSYICINILYWHFSLWLSLLCIISSSFIHFIRNDSNSFFRAE